MTESQYGDCAVVIVCYNSARRIRRLLESLPAATQGLRTRCIVVDNDSADETMSVATSREDVAVIQAGANLGYAGAINLARAHIGSCSSLLILNPDLVLESGAVTALYRQLNEPGVGVVVPMLLDDDGRPYPSLRREPSLSRAAGDALFGSHWQQRPGWLSETIRGRRAYQRPRDVTWAGGACLLISTACSDAVGNWDSDRFFLYSEETDFARRARQCGYRIRYVPTARVRHEDGGSGRWPVLGALLAVNRVRYYEKYHRWPATALFRAVVVLHYLLRCRPSADPAHAAALRILVRRSHWQSLPKRGWRPPTRSAAS
jgi:GT2 family glycosyltransferase